MVTSVDRQTAEQRELEAAFELQLQNFEEEVRVAERCYQVIMTIAETHRASQQVEKVMFETFYFWDTALEGLRVALAMALARIFDEDAAYSVDKLLNVARDPRLYTAAALAARKTRLSDNADEWLSAFLEGHREPTLDDLRLFSKAIRGHRKEYKAKHLDLRRKWHAHREFTRAQAAAAVSKITDEAITEMIECLRNISNSLYQLYWNGIIPDEDSLKAPPPRDKTIAEATKELLVLAARPQ
jgi:hypothetical protein